MKTVIVGDIHGRTVWKDVLKKEHPDKMIFLGDYVSTHECISSQQQIDNLKNILALKEQNPEQFILLRGNHDMQHLGYNWAACTGLDLYVLNFMSNIDVKNQFLNCTQWVHEMKSDNQRILCSHAGITQTWMNNSNFHSVTDINKQPPSEVFAFCPDSPYDSCGDSITQPCTWVRPMSLRENAIPGYTQIVGHTPVLFFDRPRKCKAQETDDDVWLCDTLQKKGYLVIEDDLIEPRTLKNEAHP
ncbi:MAG: metallophosphoesterase [Paludibacteraceae bacterium]|nr:metallophosphoesterase [Paludibacteraceae bacterium]